MAMTLRSKFDKGNIIVVYDIVGKCKRTLKVVSIDKWEHYNGFTYKFRDLGTDFDLFEQYDELDFETQFDIKKLFMDEIDYKRWKK